MAELAAKLRLSENYFICVLRAKNICMKLNGWPLKTKEKHWAVESVYFLSQSRGLWFWDEDWSALGCQGQKIYLGLPVVLYI